MGLDNSLEIEKRGVSLHLFLYNLEFKAREWSVGKETSVHLIFGYRYKIPKQNISESNKTTCKKYNTYKLVMNQKGKNSIIIENI
jgi:hypothetical protein